MPSGNEARIAYTCKCAQTGTKMVDQRDKPIYVVALDKYFKDDKAWDKWRKANP